MKTRQQGIALVIAMGVVALATVAATAMVADVAGWVRRSDLQGQQLQAREMARAGIEWARAVFFEDQRLSTIDHLGEAWALKPPPVALENAKLTGLAEDQQGLFNLNNLLRGGEVDTTQLARLRRLLALLELPSGLADALADWLDADGEVRGATGAEDAFYASLEVPYLPANRLLADIDELALVKGFDERTLDRLRPFVSVLPQATPVNVNTAPVELIMTMIGGLRMDEARAIEAARKASPFRTVAEFADRLPPRIERTVTDVSVGSDFFVVRVRVNLGEVESRSTALLKRESGRWPIVLWRRAS